MENQIINLFTAIRMRDSKVACDLIEMDPTLVGAITRERISVMTYAIQAGNLAVVNKLLEHHAEATEEHRILAYKNGFTHILQSLEDDAGISNELYSDGEYDEFSSEEEEELRKTPLCHTNLHSLFTETELPLMTPMLLEPPALPPHSKQRLNS